MNRLAHLDFLRGLAAILVMAGHLRAMVLEDFRHSGGGPLASVFYLATGLGHQAVIVFFAMSGYLVGGKAFADIAARRFAFLPYLLRRLSRLWLVVIPALLLTAGFDALGMALTGGAGYDGAWQKAFNSGPEPGGLASDWQTFVMNAAFLQTVAAPIFGTNSPMWSLANEFWYYLFIPLALWTAIGAQRVGQRLLGLAGLGAMALLLPGRFAEGGVIWAAGALAAQATAVPRLARGLDHPAIRVLVVLALPASLLLGKALRVSGIDLMLGLAVAACLPVLARLPSPARWYDRLSRGLAEISFTVYLTHFPLLFMVVAASVAPVQQPFSLGGLALFAGLFTLALAWAILIWWLFERHTDRLYAWLKPRLLSRP